MWDSYQPSVLGLEGVKNWIKCKFELAIIVKGFEQIVEGEEYKLLEDLCVDQETKWSSLPIGFDGSLMNQILRSAHFLSENEIITQNLWQDMERNILKYSKTKKNNFFVHPDIIHKLVHILEPELMVKQKLRKKRLTAIWMLWSMAYSEDKWTRVTTFSNPLWLLNV